MSSVYEKRLKLPFDNITFLKIAVDNLDLTVISTVPHNLYDSGKEGECRKVASL